MSPTAAQRLSQRAWRLLHVDAAQALVLADQALARARARGDGAGAAWAELVRGFHQLYFALPSQAAHQLSQAEALFDAQGDRAGLILARTGCARALWRQGQVQAALNLLLPLRDEGVRLLRHDQRGVLLNAIAGCYSAQGRSAEAFAYMYEALRDAGPSRGHGFDAVLHCNLAHELLQLGDHDEALTQVERGLARCRELENGRLHSVLLVNRVICLTELGRAREALDNVRQVAAAPRGSTGRGLVALHFESLALGALRAGEAELGRHLIAQAPPAPVLPEERLELALAQALLAQADGHRDQALAIMAAATPLLATQGDEAPGLRLLCGHAQLQSELLEATGDAAGALRALRHWQALQAQRARLASGARYQAAALETELLNLQHQLEANEAKRRATEQARAELAIANEALQRKVTEVQALQSKLVEQATQDALTGLANRRHLNDSLPGLVALALREAAPLAVVVIDMDRFKQVNDDHGHPAGDQLLTAFGKLLRQHLRRSDLPFRYGGEEFCVLMPHTAAIDAKHTIEALLQSWRDQAFSLDGGATLRDQSFSAGVADTINAPPTPVALLRAADQLLLLAKRAGRGRVLVPGAVAH